MNDSELYDLEVEICDVANSDVANSNTLTVDQQIALLRVKAYVALGYQMNRLGVLIEELIEPGPSRWQRVKGWMHVKGWLS